MLRAQDFQRPDDQARAKAEAADAGIAADLTAAMNKQRDAVDMDALEAALAVGALGTALAALHLDLFEGYLIEPLDALMQVYDDTARAEVAEIAAQVAQETVQAQVEAEAAAAAQATGLEAVAGPELLAEAGITVPTVQPIALSYDPLAPEVVAEQQAARQAVMDALTTDAQATARSAIADGLARYLSPAEIAQNVRDAIGLTERQAQAVANYRQALIDGSSQALDRTLRDRRFDATVQRLVDGSATSADAAKIDRMVERYAERQLSYRAGVIANTESLRAANEGKQAAWLQYAARTRRDPATIRRFWAVAIDERVCPSCRMVPILNPDGVPLGEPYETELGPVDMPPLHPNCRCSETFSRDAATQQSEG